MQGASTRIGVYKCYQCRKQFSVKVGTVFESSHVPLNIWLQAVALLTSSKKGMSSNQLHRILGVTLKTAWFMSHRIREAMRDGIMAPMGGNGGVVEADETISAARRTRSRLRSAGAVPTSSPPAPSARFPWCRLLNAAARSAASMSRTPTRRP
jgi:hypothetical protein